MAFDSDAARCSTDAGVRCRVVTCSLPDGERQNSLSAKTFLFQDIEKLFTIDISSLFTRPFFYETFQLKNKMGMLRCPSELRYISPKTKIIEPSIISSMDEMMPRNLTLLFTTPPSTCISLRCIIW